jgi:hypothetical protein
LNERKLLHCGKCPDLMCERFSRFKNPDVSDEIQAGILAAMEQELRARKYLLFALGDYFLIRIQKGDPRRYDPISPILAPFSRSGRLFNTNSGKTSTNVLGIPRFSAYSAFRGYIGS